MNLKKIINVLIILILASSLGFTQAKSDKKDDYKYTTRNIMLKTIYTTKLGTIIEYHINGTDRLTYLPNKFFDAGIAAKVIEDEVRATPQASLFYRDLEPFKVKIYMPRAADGSVFRVIEVLSKEQTDKFNTDKLVFDLSEIENKDQKK